MTKTSDDDDLRLSSADAVTNQVRRELLSGAIAPSSRILPKDLAERFSVSHIPIREALRRLEAEGLVVSSPQRATYAADIGIDDLAGLYELRRVVEGEFAWRSTGIASPIEIAQVERSFKSMADAEPFSDEFLAIHRSFHWYLLAPAGSDVTRRFLERLWLGVDRYLALALRQYGSFSGDTHYGETMAEHRGLRDAFVGRDPDQVHHRLLTHLTRTEERLRAAYSDYVPVASTE